MVASFKDHRPRCLREPELTVLDLIPLDVDCTRVRVYECECSGLAGKLRRLVLRTSRNRAVALGNHIFLPDWCQGDIGVLAHELTHSGQFQAWGPIRYFARGIAAQLQYLLHQTLRIGSSPYQYQVTPGKPFESYGMEQQAQIVEDRCRACSFDQATPSA